MEDKSREEELTEKENLEKMAEKIRESQSIGGALLGGFLAVFFQAGRTYDV
ncbi:MAG: hypothetical protein ACOC5A_06980 [Halanaerobiales bacterium]